MVLMCGQREIEEMRRPSGNLEVLYWVLLEIFAENDEGRRDGSGQESSPGQALGGAERRTPLTPAPPQKRGSRRSAIYSDGLICMILVMIQFNSQERPDFKEVQYIFKDVTRMENCQYFL